MKKLSKKKEKEIEGRVKKFVNSKEGKLEIKKLSEQSKKRVEKERQAKIENRHKLRIFDDIPWYQPPMGCVQTPTN